MKEIQDNNDTNKLLEYIDNRIAKLKFSMSRYEKESMQRLIYKNLIMELTNMRIYVKTKIGKE